MSIQGWFPLWLADLIFLLSKNSQEFSPTPQFKYWSRLPFPTPGDLPNPGIEPVSFVSSALAGGFFNTSATWEALLVKNLPANAGDIRDSVLIPVRKIPWNKKWQPTPVFSSGKFHGQRSLVGYGPQLSQTVGQDWACTNTHTHHRGKVFHHTPMLKEGNFLQSGLWI